MRIWMDRRTPSRSWLTPIRAHLSPSSTTSHLRQGLVSLWLRISLPFSCVYIYWAQTKCLLDQEIHQSREGTCRAVSFQKYLRLKLPAAILIRCPPTFEQKRISDIGTGKGRCLVARSLPSILTRNAMFKNLSGRKGMLEAGSVELCIEHRFSSSEHLASQRGFLVCHSILYGGLCC